MLPVVIFWLVLMGPTQASIPFDSMDKCETAGTDTVNRLKSKGFKTADYICVKDSIDIPAVSSFFSPL